MSATIHLRPGHVQPIWAGHPWVYAQAIARIDGGSPSPGDEVSVVDPQGHLLGRGFWSPRRAIPLRIVSRERDESLEDSRWVVDRLKRAVARRRAIGLPDRTADRRTSGYRLLHAEGDEVPGLVVDLFGVDEDGKGGVAVVQIGTAGLARRSKHIADALEQVVRPSAIVDRSSPSVAQGEGFTLEPDAVARFGPVDTLRFAERGLAFEIPGDLAQKTGFYFDQRVLRARVEELSRGRRVLDAFSYVGAIAISAARGGASEVAAIDDSLRAIEVGAQCARLNGVSVAFTRGDVRKDFPKLVEEKRRFDLVILDPPKLAPTRGDRDAGFRYQMKLFENAAPLVEPGGLVVASSCSAAIGANDLARALAIAARRVGRRAILLDRLGQGGDHPVPAAFSEGLYLSTIVAELG